MRSVSRTSIDPLGGNGDDRHRLLFHHLPLAVICAALVALFSAAPMFDVTADRHADLVSHALPQVRVESTPAGVRSHGSERHVSAVLARTGHGTEHAVMM